MTTVADAPAPGPAGASRARATYVFPRPGSGTSVLGGTREALAVPAPAGGGEGEAERGWSAYAAPSDEVTREILGRCKRWCPELLDERGEFEVVSVQVGLRPEREGGPRVEVERVGGRVVCHAYGHAGAG